MRANPQNNETKRCACGGILEKHALFCGDCGALAPGLALDDTGINATAHIEGWTISQCTYCGEEGPPYQLQKLDVRRVFKTDRAAWEHVYRLAKLGSYLHEQALLFLTREAPTEAAAIEELCGALCP